MSRSLLLGVLALVSLASSVHGGARVDRAGPGEGRLVRPPAGASAGRSAVLPGSDGASLRAAYDSDRHAVAAVGHGHRARNPGQRWTTTFDGRGSTTWPDAGGWTWGLELVCWGFEGSERALPGSACASAEGQRLEYAWDASLSEWYLNDARGLEHGFTVRARPEGEGTLVFTLAVRGGLVARVHPDAAGVSFSDDEGRAALTYAGLVVLDADGRALPAGLALAPEGLRLLVDERGARYPLTIDPVAQEAYLKASNTDPGDEFGLTVAVSGDTAVIGAPREDSSATGVNGNQADNGAGDSGAAYVFTRSGTVWSQQAYLKASNTGATDYFGISVAISADTLVIGAHGEDSGATDSGAAYVFVRSGTSWNLQALLKASNSEATDVFGSAVAISGDTIVVGAQAEDSSATGVNGNQADNGAGDSGAAYVFTRSGTVWGQQAYLKASNTGGNDNFGCSVSISGDTAVVGARFESSNATGVNGNQADNSTVFAGAAYVFARAGSTWSQTAYLKASNTGLTDLFGAAVSVSGDTIAVGAYFEDSDATGVGGNQSSNLAGDSGAVYVFVLSGTAWSQEAYVKASNTGANDSFGFATALSGDVLLVGAYGEDSSATGVGGNQADNGTAGSGAAYLFARNGSTWSQTAYLKASNTGAGDAFGAVVALSGETSVIGAYLEESGATGVDGNQADNGATLAGAAYAFRAPTVPASFCFGDGVDTSHTTACPCGNVGAVGNGCANSANAAGANLATTGAPATDDVVLLGSGMPALSSCIYLQGDALDDVVFGDGVRCTGGSLLRLRTKTNVGGASAFPDSAETVTLSQRGGVTPGSNATRYFQTYYRNAAASFCPPETFNVTNGVRVVW